MSRDTPSTSEITSTITESAEEEFVWPEYTPSPAHRNFLERLKRARIERGFSIVDMSDEVGLTYRLASEFEQGVTPLPFEWLEVWCQVVGVPFDDFLTIYFADEREWAERQDDQQEPCITNTEASTLAPTNAPAPALSPPHREFGFLNLLRSVAAHIRDRFLSRFSTPRKTSK